jgi:integrase
VQRRVTASTQKQARCALVFLYRYVLQQEIDLSTDAVLAKQSRYLPIVLTSEEAITVIGELSGVYQLVVKLLYGNGLRLSEALQLRVKDSDFAHYHGLTHVLNKGSRGVRSPFGACA